MILQLKSINEIKIFEIMSKTLSSIDPKLSAHGDRTAYIVMKMLRKKGIQDNKQLAEAVLVAMLHDIGVYQKEEIGNISKFDSDKSWNHSIVGYAILENLSPLGNQADAVLYHHLDYDKFEQVDSPNRKLAQVIRVSDRYDIGGFNLGLIQKFSGSKFNPEVVDTLAEVCKENDFKDIFSKENYKSELQNLYSHIEVTSGTLKEWLRTIVYPLNFQGTINALHNSYIAIVASEIARFCGLSDQEVSDEYLMGALQDIGIAHAKSSYMAEIQTLSILRGSIPDRMLESITANSENFIGTERLGNDTFELPKLTLILIAANYIAHEIHLLDNDGYITEQDISNIIHKHKAKCYIPYKILDRIVDNLPRLASEINTIGEDVKIIHSAITRETQDMISKLSNNE